MKLKPLLKNKNWVWIIFDLNWTEIDLDTPFQVDSNIVQIKSNIIQI